MSFQSSELLKSQLIVTPESRGLCSSWGVKQWTVVRDSQARTGASFILQGSLIFEIFKTKADGCGLLFCSLGYGCSDAQVLGW